MTVKLNNWGGRGFVEFFEDEIASSNIPHPIATPSGCRMKTCFT